MDTYLSEKEREMIEIICDAIKNSPEIQKHFHDVLYDPKLINILRSLHNYPILDFCDIPQKKWNDMSEKQAISNFTKINGYAPADSDEAKKWQKNYFSGNISNI